MDGAPAVAPASASPAGPLAVGSEGRTNPQLQQGAAPLSSAHNSPAAYSIAVRPSHEVSSTAVALLHQELLLYVLRRCSPTPRSSEASPEASPLRVRPTSAAAAATAAALPVLHSSGFRVGSRVAERLTLKCSRMPEQRECVKFVCKDLWHFLFQKQADRLQTNRRGGYVIHDANLPWLRRVSPFAAPPPPPAAAAAAVAAAGKGSQSLQQQLEDELLRAAATQPQLHVAFVCGAIRGALAALGLECTQPGSTMSRRCGRCAALCAEVFDSLRDLRDPEFPAETLEDLQVILPELIVARCTGSCSRHSSSSSKKSNSSSGSSSRKDTPRRVEVCAVYTNPWEEDDCSSCCTRCSSNRCSFESCSSSSSSGSSSSSSGLDFEDVEGCTPDCRCCCIVVSVHPTSPRCSFASLLGLLIRCRLALDFAPADAASLAINGSAFPRQLEATVAAAATAAEAAEGDEAATAAEAAAEEAAAAAVGSAAEGGVSAVGAWGYLPFVRRRLCLWLRVCAHEAAADLTKQLNDKERVAAALETPHIRGLIMRAMRLDED
ncbi:hypothetical protein ACSSS7_004036 [Eimeria intestinalis]